MQASPPLLWGQPRFLTSFGMTRERKGASCHSKNGRQGLKSKYHTPLIPPRLRRGLFYRFSLAYPPCHSERNVHPVCHSERNEVERRILKFCAVRKKIPRLRLGMTETAGRNDKSKGRNDKRKGRNDKRKERNDKGKAGQTARTAKPLLRRIKKQTAVEPPFSYSSMTPAAGGAMPAAIFYGLARCGIHLTRPIALRPHLTVGAKHLFFAMLYELVKLLPATRAAVLQYRHKPFLLSPCRADACV